VIPRLYGPPLAPSKHAAPLPRSRSQSSNPEAGAGADDAVTSAGPAAQITALIIVLAAFLYRAMPTQALEEAPGIVLGRNWLVRLNGF